MGNILRVIMGFPVLILRIVLVGIVFLRFLMIFMIFYDFIMNFYDSL